MSMSEAFSVPFCILIKLCYTKALKWSSLVPGPEAKSSSEIMNLTSLTISYQFYRINFYTKIPDSQYACMHVKLLQSYITLCNLMNCGLPSSSVHGILQVRMLEWAALPSSKGTSWPRDQIPISYVSYIGRWVLYTCGFGSAKNWYLYSIDSLLFTILLVCDSI